MLYTITGTLLLVEYSHCSGIAGKTVISRINTSKAGCITDYTLILAIQIVTIFAKALVIAHDEK